MALNYTTVLGFVEHIKSLKVIPSADTADQNNDSYSTSGYEIVGTGDNTRLLFFLNNIGVIEDTYVIYYGADDSNLTALTETTDYSLDLDNSQITLTTAGRTAVGTNKIFAEYKYNSLDLLNSLITSELGWAEDRVLSVTEQTFANYTDTNPSYLQITDEEFYMNNPSLSEYGKVHGKALEMYYQPLVRLSTTTDGDYTSGGTTIDLVVQFTKNSI